MMGAQIRRMDLAAVASWLLRAPVRPATWRWALFLLGGLLTGVLALGAGFAGVLTEALLVVTVVGIPVMLILVRGLRLFTDLERRRLASAGVLVASPYAPAREGSTWLARLTVPLRDPATLRDLAWLLLAGPVGIAAGLASTLSWVTAVASLSLPVWYRWLPMHRAVLESTSGHQHFVIDSVPSALPYAAGGLLLIWVSAWLTAGFSRGQAWLMRGLLGRGPRQRLSEAIAGRQAAVSSQQRLVDRLVRDLHDGAQARLIAASLDLNLALQTQDDTERQKLIQQAQASSRAALAELRDLVRGIEPPLLRERGLLGALDALAREAPQPVHVAAEMTAVLPRPLASAAYFIVAEALANVAKHSSARAVAVEIFERAGDLVVIVSDDGQGGADPHGAGLRGLADRAHALGGTITVDSPAGGPTKIEVRLPCG
jgi:signal transduction histidine kinase